MKGIVKSIALFAALALGAAAFAQTNNTIAVPAPKTVNIGNGNEWIPLFVQGVITSNFAQYSGMKVIDRQNADMVKAEQRLSEGAEFDETTAIELGKLTSARLIITGNITGKSASYALMFSITDAETGETKATATVPNCLFSALENGEAANQISYDLMTGYGIKLDASAKAKLTQKTSVMSAGTAAQQNLAKGIVAEKNNTLEAMTYYLKASGEDGKLREAEQRISTVSAKVSTGDWGANARNLITLRKEWIALLQQAVDTVVKNPLPIMYVYSGDLEPTGKIDYDKSLMEFKWNYGELKYNGGADILATLKEAVDKIPESKKWGEEVTGFPSSLAPKDSWLRGQRAGGWITRGGRYLINSWDIKVEASVRDANGKKLADVSHFFDFYYENRAVQARRSGYYYQPNGRLANNFLDTTASASFNEKAHTNTTFFVPVETVEAGALTITIDSVGRVYNLSAAYENRTKPRWEKLNIPVLTKEQTPEGEPERLKALQKAVDSGILNTNNLDVLLTQSIKDEAVVLYVSGVLKDAGLQKDDVITEVFFEQGDLVTKIPVPRRGSYRSDVLDLQNKIRVIPGGSTLTLTVRRSRSTARTARTGRTARTRTAKTTQNVQFSVPVTEDTERLKTLPEEKRLNWNNLSLTIKNNKLVASYVSGALKDAGMKKEDVVTGISFEKDGVVTEIPVPLIDRSVPPYDERRILEELTHKIETVPDGSTFTITVQRGKKAEEMTFSAPVTEDTERLKTLREARQARQELEELKERLGRELQERRSWNNLRINLTIEKKKVVVYSVSGALKDAGMKDKDVVTGISFEQDGVVTEIPLPLIDISVSTLATEKALLELNYKIKTVPDGSTFTITVQRGKQAKEMTFSVPVKVYHF